VSGRAGLPQGTVVCTVVNAPFVPFARVLAASVKAHHPEVRVVAGGVGPGVAATVRSGDAFELLDIASIAMPHFDAMRFRYPPRTLVTASKAGLIRHLIAQGARRVLYLDADVLVCGDLSPLVSTSDASAIGLTPHLLRPLTGQGRVARELNILQAGTYNGGCLSLSDGPEVRRFLDWWHRRNATHARHSGGEGLHGDQKWLDLVPSLFEGVDVIRDPGVNVAYWNLPERRVRRRPGGWTVNGEPLRFFHFSGFDPSIPDVPCHHAPSLQMADLGEAAVLFADYARRAVAAGFETRSPGRLAPRCWDNGTAVSARSGVAVRPRSSTGSTCCSSAWYDDAAAWWNSSTITTSKSSGLMPASPLA
jgi:hypothetical protein